MSIAARSGFEHYLSSGTNTFFHKGNYWTCMVDDGIFRLGQHGAALGQHISKLNGDKISEERCANVSNGFGAGRDAIGAIRFIFPIHKLFTGQMFWQTDGSGWRRVQYNTDGSPVRILKEDLGTAWKKKTEGSHKGEWYNASTKKYSADGKYVDDVAGSYVTKDWMDIAMDILVLVARVLSPIRWLHNLKAIDLGKHAKWMGGVIMGIWGAVLAINFVQSIRDLVDEVDLIEVRQKIANAVCAFFDMVSLPFDFGAGASVPALAITGAVLNIVSAGAMLFKEAMYYG